MPTGTDLDLILMQWYRRCQSVAMGGSAELDCQPDWSFDGANR